MNYPQTLFPTLEALYQLGRRVCSEVENFQPDLVIGLAHSGWMPVTVASTLWSEIHVASFPPTLRTNIGHEKYAIYQERFQPPMPAYCCSECCGNSPDRLGHYLAWIADQRRWQEVLRSQMRAAYPYPPARVLVVDDLFGGRRTCYIALGLLETLYPRAEIRMIAGERDLTNAFIEAWLSQFAPALGRQIAPLHEPQSRTRYAHPLYEQLKPLISGSEDIVPQSLKWRPLTPQSAAVKALDGLVEPETILAAPAWASSLACQYALQRQHGEIPGSEDDTSLRQAAFTTQPAARLFRQAWLNNGITRREIAHVYENQPRGLAAGLKQLREYAQPHGHGRGTVYLPVEATESWVHAYDPPGSAETEPHGLRVTGFGEFIPGRLWAGAYPFQSHEIQVSMLADLLMRGVRRIINLTNPGEYYTRWPYQEALNEASKKTGTAVEIIRFPLPFRTASTRRRLLDLITEIQSSLATGQGVYLHAGHNLEGRVPMVLACLLIHQGHAPQEALSTVTAFWLQVLPYLIRLPLTDAQRGLVLRWRKSASSETQTVVDFDPNPGVATKQQAPRLVALSAGRLGLWGKPSPQKLADWHERGLTTLVSLLSEAEGASKLGQSAQRLGVEWFWFDQPNGNNLPPERQGELLRLLEAINRRIDAGAWVVMHCAAGMHRTGMAAYALLRLRGLSPAEALGVIRLARPVTHEGVGPKRLAWVEEWLAAKEEKNKAL